MTTVTIVDPIKDIVTSDFTQEYLNDYIDGLDAALFSGDPFYDKGNRDLLRSFLCRWERKLVDIETELKDGAAT